MYIKGDIKVSEVIGLEAAELYARTSCLRAVRRVLRVASFVPVYLL